MKNKFYLTSIILIALIITIVPVKRIQADESRSTELIALSLRAAERAASGSSSSANKTLSQAGNMSELVGVIFDNKQNDIILLGAKRQGDTTFTLDDLVSIMRAADMGGLNGPGVSLEQQTGNSESQNLDVFFFGGLEDTKLGKVCFEADYLMKKLALEKLPLNVTGIDTYANHYEKRFKQEKHETWNVLSRFWFAPIYSPVSENPEGDIFLIRETNVGVLVQTLSAEINGQRDPAYVDLPASTFADQFTFNYANVAENYPVFKDLERQMGALKVMLMLLARAPEGVLDYWLYTFKPAPEKIPKEVPILEKKIIDGRRQLSVVGGVRIAGLTTRLRKGEIAAIRDAILFARPDPTSITWEIKLDSDWRIDIPSITDKDREIARLFSSGMIEREKGDDKAALKYFEQICNIYPDVAEARFFSAICRRDSAVKEGRVEKAANVTEHLHQLADEMPNIVEIRYELGVTKLALGNYDKAITDLQRVVEKRKDFAPAYHALGRAYFSNGDDVNAKAALNKYFEIDKYPESKFSKEARNILAKIENIKKEGGKPQETKWKTYTDAKSGFMTYYPDDWDILTGQDVREILPDLESAKAVAVAFKHPRDADNNVNIRITPFPVDKLTEKDITDSIPQLDKAYKSRFTNFRKVEAGSVEVGGIKGIRYVFKSDRAGTALEQCVVTLVKSKKAYTVTFTAREKDYEELSKQYFEQMLSSFKLLNS